MADTALKGSTISNSYDWLIFRETAFQSTGNKINLMNDSGVIQASNFYIDPTNDRIGIGTADPTSILHTQGTGSQSVKVESTDNNSSLIISTGDESSKISGIYFDAVSATKGSIIFNHNATAANQNMRFLTGDNGTTAMTIEGDGNIGIGTTSPGTIIDVKVSSGDAFLRLDTTGSSTYSGVALDIDNTNVWDIKANGGSSNRLEIFDASGDGVTLAQNSTATPGWVGTSDENLKTDISTISDALTKINQIRGVNFKWKKYKEGAPNIRPITEENDSGITNERWEEIRSIKDSNNVGLIAQEVNNVLPEAVDTTKDGEWGVVYTAIIPLITEALKELSAKVEALENA